MGTPTLYHRGGMALTEAPPKRKGRSSAAPLPEKWNVELVAGDSFGFFLLGVAVRRRELHRLRTVGLGEARRCGLGNVRNAADLNHRRLRLLQHKFFVNGANFSLLFVSLLAAGALFFGGCQGNIMLEMADTRGVRGVNLQRMLVALQVHVLALGVDLVLAVGLVPDLRQGQE